MRQPPSENFFRTHPNPTSYISLEREFIGNSDSFLILDKYVVRAKFQEMTTYLRVVLYGPSCIER